MQKPIVAFAILFFSLPLFSQSTQCLSLYLSSEAAAPGEEVCLEVTAGEYESLLGVLFEMRWDTSVLAFKRVEGLQLPNLYEYNFNLLPEAVNNGRTVLTWYDPSITGVRLEEGQSLFSLCFEVVGSPGDFGRVRFAPRNGVIELADGDANAVDAFSLANGGVLVSGAQDELPQIVQACSQANNCLGDNAINITVEGGQPPYTYTWMRDSIVVSSSPGLQGQEPGEYALTITDAAGRQATGFFSAIPELFLQLEDRGVWSTSCVGASDGRIALLIGNGSGTYAYQWSNGGEGPFLDSLTAGTYTVTVTDEFTGCVKEWAFDVFDGRPKGVAVEIEPAACNAAIGSIGLQMNGSNTFLWSNGATTEDIDSLSAGSYTVTITHEVGCFARTFEVPELEGPYFSSEVTQPECGGSNGAIEVQAPGQGLSFHWNTGDEGPVLNGLSSGYYEVTVSNGNGCEATSGFELLSGSLLAVPTVTCRANGAELLYTVWDGGQPPYTFEWSTGLTETTLRSSAVNGLPDGSYSVSITDSEGCNYIVDTLVANCDGPQLELSLSTTCRSYADTAFTVLEAVAGGGAGPYTFEWSNGVVEVADNTSRVGVVDNGFYSVQVRDASGDAFAQQWVQVFCEKAESAALTVSDAQVSNGEAVTLEVRLGPVFGLDSLRLPLYWESPQLRLDSITGFQLPGLTPEDFQLATYTAGDYTFRLLELTWANADSQHAILEEGELLFELHFSVDGLPGAVEYVRWGDEWLGGPAQVLLKNGTMPPLSLDDGRIDIRYYSNAAPLVLKAEKQTVAVGSLACLEVQADNFTEMITTQFSMEWDPDTLDFISLQPGVLAGLDGGYFSLAEVDEGRLGFSWSTNAPGGLTLPAGAGLFSVCFETSPQPGYSPFRFVSEPLPIQANAYTGVLPYAVAPGGLKVALPDVWPGDTDDNGLASHFDLLNIGLAYNATGLARLDTGIAWRGYLAEDWWQQLPRSGVNYKHIDADGNGRINAADTLAIAQHWGAVNGHFDPGAPLFPGSSGLVLNAPLMIQPRPVAPGQAAAFDVVLGEETAPAYRVYGLAFTIHYDTAAAVPGSSWLSFENSWLGDGLLTLYRNRPSGNAVDVAITRTNRTNAFGFGPVATLHLRLREQPQSRRLPFRIDGLRLLDRNERPMWVRTRETAAVIVNSLSETEDQAGNPGIELYPNPTGGELFLKASGAVIQQVELFGTDGRKVETWMAPSGINLESYPAGIYFLKVFTDRGVVMEAVSVVR